MAKKKARQMAPKAATDEPLIFICKTDEILRETWKSKIRGSATVNDGEFKIGQEDAFGNFFGLHTSGEIIRGCCFGDRIWFVMPAGDPRFIYKGVPDAGDPQIVRGTRSSIPPFSVAVGSAVQDDEWVAEKTT